MVMKDRWQYGKRDANWVAKILKKFDLHRGKVLELGCGNGRVCIPLAKKGYEVTGVDISPMYIEDARKMAKRNKVIARFLVGDIREIDKLLEGEHSMQSSAYGRRSDITIRLRMRRSSPKCRNYVKRVAC